jgi:hypothetical protein
MPVGIGHKPIVDHRAAAEKCRDKHRKLIREIIERIVLKIESQDSGRAQIDEAREREFVPRDVKDSKCALTSQKVE